MVLLAINPVYAIVTGCSADTTKYVQYDGIGNASVDKTIATVNEGMVTGGWTDKFQLATYGRYAYDPTAEEDLTMRIMPANEVDAESPIMTAIANGCVQVNIKVPVNTSLKFPLFYMKSGTTNIARVGLNPGAGNQGYWGWYFTVGGDASGMSNIPWTPEWTTGKICQNNSIAYIYIDDVLIQEHVGTATFDRSYILVTHDQNISYDSYLVWNYTEGSGDGRNCPAEPPDTIPPVISNYNLTIDGNDNLGNTTWNDDNTIAVPVVTGRTILTFETDEPSNCSVRTINQSYNSTYPCQTTGDTSHSCKLYTDDILVYGVQNLYVGCDDALSNHGYSPALSINMTAGSFSQLISCIIVGEGCTASYLDGCYGIWLG